MGEYASATNMTGTFWWDREGSCRELFSAMSWFPIHVLTVGSAGDKHKKHSSVVGRARAVRVHREDFRMTHFSQWKDRRPVPPSPPSEKKKKKNQGLGISFLWASLKPSPIQLL